MSAFVPVPSSFDYYCFVGCFEIRYCDFSSFALFVGTLSLSLCLSASVSVSIYLCIYKFGFSMLGFFFSSSMKNFTVSWDENCVESIDYKILSIDWEVGFSLISFFCHKCVPSNIFYLHSLGIGKLLKMLVRQVICNL